MEREAGPERSGAAAPPGLLASAVPAPDGLPALPWAAAARVAYASRRAASLCRAGSSAADHWVGPPARHPLHRKHPDAKSPAGGLRPGVMAAGAEVPPRTVPAGRQDREADRGSSARRRRLPGALARGLLSGATAAALILLLVVALPVPFGYRSLVVMSGSMEPAIPTGSLLLVRRISAAQVAVGDVVSFRHPDEPGRLLTHRVQAVSTEDDRVMVQTRGDANTGAENWVVPASGTVGRATWHLPLLGYLVVPLQGTAARILLLVAPALALAVLLLVDIWRPGSRRPGRRPAPLPAGGGAS